MCTRSIWVEIITMLYHVCYAMIEPSVKVHIYETLCAAGNYSTDCSSMTDNNESSVRVEDAVQKYAAKSLVYMKLMRSFPALLIIIFCGAWSDNIGRKLPILFPFIGMLLSLLLYLISYAPGVNVYSVLLGGGFISGLFGEVGLILMAGYSYVTDVTESSERTNRLGRLMAMSFFGQFVGSLIVGIMIQVTLVRNIFIFAMVINGLSIVVIVTFLQDSLTDKTKSVIVFKPTYLVETWQVITKPREHKKRMYIILLITIIALYQACLWGEYDITMLYVRHKPLWWNPSKYGYYLAGGFFASGLGTILLLPILAGHFKVSDFSLAMVAVAFKVVQVSWASFSTEDWMVFLGLPMMVASSMFVPALKSILSKLIAEGEVGKIFGLAAFGETISGLLGAVMFTAVYGASVHLWKGTAFILEAIVCIAVFGILLWMSNNYTKHYGSSVTEDIGAKKAPLTVQVDNNFDYGYTPTSTEPENTDDQQGDYTIDEPGHSGILEQNYGQVPYEKRAEVNGKGYTNANNRRQQGDVASHDDEKPQLQGHYGY